MKTKIYLVLAVLLFMAENSRSQIPTQTLVNLAWKDTVGHPSIMNNYFSGISDIDNGVFYMVGNIFVTGEQENFFVGKIDASDGNLLWLQNYNSIGSNRDFGLDLAVKGSYVYTTGLSWDSANSRSSITTLKIDAANGDTVWTARYANAYNGYNAAADIAIDDTGNVFIVGTEQTGLLNFGMIALKYDSFGNQVWAGEYDSAYMYDAAVAMNLDPGKNLAVTGFSGSGFGAWDFVTVGFDPQTGALLAYNRYGNGAGNFSQPVGITRGMNDEIYIAGTASYGGHTYIKLIAYDSLMNQIYVKGWGDSTLNQEAIRMEDDMDGNLLIGGTQTKANGGKDMVLVSFRKDDGSLSWSTNVPASDPTKEASLKDIANDGYGGCYITGKMHNGNDFDIATAYIKPDGNLDWLKTFSRGASTNDQPDGIAYDDNGGIVVTATSMGGDTVYLMLGNQEVKAFIPTDSLNPNTAYAFYENRGQITYNDSPHTQADSILYYTNAGSPQLYVADKRLSYVMAHENTDSVPYVDTTYRIDMQFTGTHERVYDPKMNFDDAKTNAFLNYYLGYIPEPVTNVEGHNRIVRKRVYEHIDWEICSTVEGIKNYFIVGRNGDVSDIQLKYSGADSISIVGDSMQLFIGGSYIQFAPLTAYSVDTAGTSTAVGVHFTALGGNEFGFAVDSFGEDDILVVEKRLSSGSRSIANGNITWSTYYGGNTQDVSNDIKTDNSGNLFITGHTGGGTFPTSTNVSIPHSEFGLSYLIKFDNTGVRAWSTFFGGSYTSEGIRIAVNSSNEIFVLGHTQDSDLPIIPSSHLPIPAYRTPTGLTGFDGGPVSYITRVSQSGSITWEEYFAGLQEDILFANNNLYMVGTTNTYFPYVTSATSTTTPFNYTSGNASITKFNASLEIKWSTACGASWFNSLAKDQHNNIFIVGESPNLTNFPAIFQLKHSGSEYFPGYGGGNLDGVLIEFDPDDNLLYSTFIGGGEEDNFTGIASAPVGDDFLDYIYICGYTESTDFPTYYSGITAPANFKGTSYTGSTGQHDGVYVSMLAYSKVRTYATYMGGTGFDFPTDIVAKNFIEGAYVTGYTNSTDLVSLTPTDYFTQPAKSDPLHTTNDGFICHFNEDILDWSTYLGGIQNDEAMGIALSGGYNLYITGWTASPQNTNNPSDGYPLYNNGVSHFQPYLSNVNTQPITQDAFITEFDLNATATSILKVSGKNSFIVYPNPASNYIRILQTDVNQKEYHIEIFNILGQTVYKSNQPENMIDISHFAEGIYLLKLEQEGIRKTTKFIKE